jgi:hypothetical protein
MGEDKLFFNRYSKNSEVVGVLRYVAMILDNYTNPLKVLFV